MTPMTNDLKSEFSRIIARAHQLSGDVGAEVEEILGLSDAHLLDPTEARLLLSKVIAAIRKCQQAAGYAPVDPSIEEVLLEDLVLTRVRLLEDQMPKSPLSTRIELLTIDGIAPRPIKPSPTFHAREVALNEGFVRTRDINLWDRNERLEIHLQQFQKKHGRTPTPQELIDIMLSNLKLDGLPKEDQFDIPALARSIAANGLRKPPIIALDGRLLDGNRRVTACYYILNSNEFTSEQKQRVEYIQVWQLTEHATRPDEDAIIVSLNFEKDHKQEWPAYVRARKIYDEWAVAIALEPRTTAKRQQDIKREISVRFALGTDLTVVNRAIKMVENANDFEDHHIFERKRDQFEVKHKASEHFEYFDELSKGTNPGGVAYTLNQDTPLKGVVYELLFTDKFKSWKQIRDLRYVGESSEARQILFDAASTVCTNEDQLDEVQEKVETALSIGRVRKAEQRLVGSNTRIEAFVKWLLDLPLSAFQGEIKPENIARLHGALKLVDGIVANQDSVGGRTIPLQSTLEI